MLDGCCNWIDSWPRMYIGPGRRVCVLLCCFWRSSDSRIGTCIHHPFSCGRYYTRLTLDFDTNKRICDEIAKIPSKKLRNKISGFITHLMKRIQVRPYFHHPCQRAAAACCDHLFLTLLFIDTCVCPSLYLPHMCLASSFYHDCVSFGPSRFAREASSVAIYSDR